MKFQDIPQFAGGGGYEVNVPLDQLIDTMKRYQDEYGLILEPDFQRGHVWNINQRIKYMEYFLQGGKSGLIIYLNQPSWQSNKQFSYDEFVLVDGLQRLTTLIMFMNNNLEIFGNNKLSDFTDKIRMSSANFNLRINVNNLKTKKEVLTWYLEMNSGGTPHTESELNKVKDLIINLDIIH